MPKATTTTATTTENAMPTDSALTTMSNTSSALAINPELMAELSGLNRVESDQTSRVTLPSAVFMNQKEDPNHGLFIEGSALIKAGWTGPEPKDSVSFKSNGGSKTIGVKYHNPRIQVIARSRPFIEVKAEKGWQHPMTGEVYKHRQRIGVFDSPEGQQLYSLMNPEGGDKRAGSLRTIFVIYLLDDSNKPLHQVPLFLSLHGTAAMRFNESWKQFCAEMRNVRCRMTGQVPNLFEEQPFTVTARYVFCPELEAGLEGTAPNTAYITRPKDWVHPSPENFMSLYLPGEEWGKRIETFVEGSNRLFDGYLAQIAQYGYTGILASDAPKQVEIKVLPGTGEDLE